MLFDRFALAQRLGKAGLYLFAVSGFISQGGVYAGLGLMLLGMLLTPALVWHSLRRQALLVPAVVLSVYIAASGFAAHELWVSSTTDSSWRDTWDLIAIGGLFALLVGWWLDGNNRRIALVLQLAVTGLLIGVLKGIPWEHFSSYMLLRPLFGMGNGAGLYSLLAMLGLLILRSSCLFEGNWYSRLPSAVHTGGLILLFAVFAVVFLFSQTRAAWLAALMVVPVVTALLLRKRAGKPQKRLVTGFEILVLGAFIAAVTLGAGTIEKRLGAEQGSLVMLFSGQLRELPADGVGQRVRLWDAALQHLAERPLLGWGAGSAPGLIGAAGLPGGLSHYHNLYLQLGVELGLMGLGLFAWWSVAVARAALRAWRERRTDFAYLLFLAATLAVFLIVSCFQIRHDDERGHYLLILMGALAVTHRLTGTKAPPTQ